MSTTGERRLGARVRVAVVGGGPGGLFLSILLRRWKPDWDITVWERNAPDATFGFGVVFSDRTVEHLYEADPSTTDQIVAEFQSWTDIEVATPAGTARTGGHGFSAVSRKRLLEILQQRARELAVDLRFRTEAPDLDELAADHDVVVGADGVNSRVRDHWSDDFGPDVHLGRARFAWFGTTRRYDALTFHFVTTEHGVLATHAYPFSEELSTFIVETDEATWRRAGLDAHESDPLPPGANDEIGMAYAEQAFAESLGGHGLVGNNSRWLRFPTIRNERWWNGGNVVLLGDAAHTAHFSVGSGTKMAMEDAAALAAALAEAVDVAGAATEYERNRRPAVDRVQRAAEPSRAWWESFGGWVSADLSTFAVNFLTRSGRELVGDLRARDPRFARAHTRGTALDEKVVLGDGLQLARRVAVVADDEAGEDPSRLRDLAAGAAAHGASLVVVPSTAVDAVGAAWPDLVDAVHRWGALVGIDRAGPGVPSDRCDLVLFAGDEPVPTDRPSIGVLIAPRGAADHDAHDRLVDVARRRRAEGVVAVGLQPAADDDDARIGLITACQRIRPAIDLPLLVWGCRSDDDAATFVHAGRADVCVGRPTFGSRWRS